MNNEKYEKELRYVLSDVEYNTFRKKVIESKECFKTGSCLFETTIMYDNPNPVLSFYNKAVDGRLRLRTSKYYKSDIFEMDSFSNNKLISMITWKQRIPQYANSEVRIEKEIEVHFESSESMQMISILNEILKCPRVSSYERIRETFYTNEIEIASDLFPYGHVVELFGKDLCPAVVDVVHAAHLADVGQFVHHRFAVHPKSS